MADDDPQQRIAKLEAELADARRDADDARPRGRRRHRALVAVLLVLGTVLTPITIVALFVNTEVTDTSRYVQNVKPLASNPAIQAYVADDVTRRLFAQADVQQYVQDVLPERAQPLTGPLTSALENFVRQTTLRVLQSSQFQDIWVQANRAAHNALVAVVTGKENGAVTASENGVVSIDLSQLAERVQQRLEDSGLDLFSRIPIARISGQIPVFQSKDLYKVRKAVGLLDTLAFVLPIVVFACFGGAIYFSQSRRRGFVASAVGFALGALVLALALNVVRGVYLDKATSRDLPYDAAAGVYDTLVRFLHTSVRAALLFSIVVVIAVFFSGPSRFAAWFRGRVRFTASWLGQQSDRAGWRWLSPPAWVVGHKGALRIAVAAVGFVIVFLWDRPTAAVIFWAAVLTLAALAIIEFFGREPMPDAGTAERPAPAVAPAPITHAPS
jgi:hypothetical protein